MFAGRVPVASSDFLLSFGFEISELVSGKLRLLNEQISYGNIVDWECRSKSKLWRYNLHYFDYLPVLASAYRNTKDKSYLDRIRQLLDSWIKNNPPVRGDGWEPYPLSVRIVNWIKTAIILKASIDEEKDIYRCLYRQCSFLNKSVERHLGGNHLIKNGKALLLGGIFFGKEKWRQHGMEILESEIEVQILKDGGHIERSPSYQITVLEDYLDVINILGNKKDWNEKLSRMLSFCRNMSHSNSRPALFNDSFSSGAPTTEAISGYFSSVTGLNSDETSDIFSYPDSGYFGAGRDSKLIIDCGPLAAPGLSAHGHCDLLSFEFSVNGERIIVDSGNFDYEEGEMRTYCRGTEAHNTVKVADYEQHEMWSVFRTAKQSVPGRCSVEHSEGIYRFTGSYTHFSGAYTHKRQILYCEDAFLAVKDIVESGISFPFVSFIHLSDKTGNFRTTKNKISFVFSKVAVELSTIGNAELRLKSGWHCPDFGLQLKNPVAVLSASMNMREAAYLLDFSPETIRISNNGFVVGNKRIGFSLT